MPPVLSIGKLTAAQTGYYERQVAQGLDDYYSGRGEAAGEWMGAGAALLGLAGEVGEEGFAALMDGLDPGTGEPLGRSRGRSTVAAFDLTFSAPKSVSVLFAVADQPTAAAMVEAHHEAVAAALEYLEAEACRVRRGHGGVERQRGAGFVAAAYRHRMSRSEDPQLHTHVVAANLARGEDGRWSALDGRALYAHAKAAGFLYQAHLRSAVRERLAWAEWGPVRNGMAELLGVPEGVLHEFSTRRRQILERERDLVAVGVSVGHAGRERVAHDTRGRKRYGIDTAPWRDLVRARAAEHGLGAAELDRLRARARPAQPPYVEHDEAARLAGPAGLTEKRNTFRKRDAVIAFAGARAQGAPSGEIIRSADSFCARDDVLRVDESPSDAIFTTLDLLACERAIVDSAARRVDERGGLLAGLTVDHALANHCRPLSGEQSRVVLAITGSGRGVDTIEALAGTGKTTTAGALTHVYRQAGYHVIGTAPTGRAVRELEEQAAIGDASTLAGLLRSLDRQGGRFLAGATVLIVDEAGMASTREVAQLLAAAERARVKVVAIGDPGQLPSVQAGGWLGSLGRRFGTHRLREVMRQRDPEERPLLERVHAGEPDLYLRHKQAAGLLQLFEGEDPGAAAEHAAVAAWHVQQAELPDGQAILICRDNDRRRRLNDAARALRSREGRLGPTFRCGDREFAVGDRAICRLNASALNVDNGTRGTLTGVDHHGGTIRLRTDSGADRTLPARYCAQHLELAYALTAHGAQGATAEWAGVIGAPADFTRNWSYTALSRSREPSELFVVEERGRHGSERNGVAAASSQDRDALEVLRLTMRRRDDEDLALDRLDVAPSGPEEVIEAARPEPAVALAKHERRSTGRDLFALSSLVCFIGRASSDPDA